MTIGLSSQPRVPLGDWPTPLYEAKRLSEQLGTRLWFKRDDLTGLGAGGNKARKLEFHLGKAFEAKATHLVTTGAAQSNHAHLTALAAKRYGLQAHLVLIGAGICPVRAATCCWMTCCKPI
ncbi:pyridoxal-phosphate dependent enzyme [Paenibacillus sp. P25]|nr:pyridoxal-phosphate dependent enzyme [Paenibacillus sp. P25]